MNGGDPDIFLNNQLFSRSDSVLPCLAVVFARAKNVVNHIHCALMEPVMMGVCVHGGWSFRDRSRWENMCDRKAGDRVVDVLADGRMQSEECCRRYCWAPFRSCDKREARAMLPRNEVGVSG